MTDTAPPAATRSLNNTELWSGAFWLALAIFVVWSGFKLEIGSISDPGSGFVLFYVGILMCLFAITIMVTAITEGGASFGSLLAGVSWGKPLLIIVYLSIFAVALEPLGFLLSAIPLMLALLRSIDPVRWPLAIPIGVLAPLVFWWVLKKGLLIQLPSGMFDVG
jgi:putative tricarboxylic transport membrane protein